MRDLRKLSGCTSPWERDDAYGSCRLSERVIHAAIDVLCDQSFLLAIAEPPRQHLKAQAKLVLRKGTLLLLCTLWWRMGGIFWDWKDERTMTWCGGYYRVRRWRVSYFVKKEAVWVGRLCMLKNERTILFWKGPENIDIITKFIHIGQHFNFIQSWTLWVPSNVQCSRRLRLWEETFISPFF